MSDSLKAAYEREEEDKSLLDRQLRLDKDQHTLAKVLEAIGHAQAGHPEDIQPILVTVRDLLIETYPLPHQSHLASIRAAFPPPHWIVQGSAWTMERNDRNNEVFGRYEIRLRKK